MTDNNSNQWLLARPEVSSAQAARLANTLFGIENATAHELGSQQDRNFAISGETNDEKHATSKLLLKIDNPQTSDAERSFQIALSNALRDAGIHTPAPVETLAGELTARFESATTDTATPANGVADSADSGSADHNSGGSYVARAFEFVEGESLMDSAWNGAVAERLGRLAGKTVATLSTFDHEAKHRKIQWEMRTAGKVVAELIDHLPENLREVCLNASEDALAALDLVKAELPLQVIHGDITRDNVMLDNFGRLWLIDLGDAAVSWRVAELAITCADVLGHTGSLAQVSRVVHGFVSESELTEAEVAALWPLIILRGAVLVVSGWSQLAIDPDNAYSKDRMEHEWDVLESAIAFDTATTIANLRLAAGYPHTPNTSYAPLIAGFENHATLDFGVESTDLDRGAWLEEDIENKIANNTMADIKVAPFGEARLTRVTGDVLNPAAARARFVEIWAPEGSVINAPFAGELTSNADSVELTNSGVTLTITGVKPNSTQKAPAQSQKIESQKAQHEAAQHETAQHETAQNEAAQQETAQNGAKVEAGAPIATVGQTSFAVSRQVSGVAQEPLFGAFDAEYVSDGALDPSPIIGTKPATDPDMRLLQEQSRRDLAMGGASERYYENPPQIERGWMSLLVETRGRAYLDMVNNVTAIGHSHPRLADSV
ncbi:MAG TPA: phosphotransferase [Microbacteriaceae bacterium]|nr:phosphotransferase [Microbacteriaceae bacterium]